MSTPSASVEVSKKEEQKEAKSSVIMRYVYGSLFVVLLLVIIFILYKIWKRFRQTTVVATNSVPVTGGKRLKNKIKMKGGCGCAAAVSQPNA